MRAMKIVLLSLVMCGLVFSSARAMGGIEKGKALFNDPKAFGGTADKSCASCHPNGKGLEKSGAKGKKEWNNPAGSWTSMEDAINVCILMANKGKVLDPKSEDMKDLVAYIKSLGKKTGKKAM